MSCPGQNEYTCYQATMSILRKMLRDGMLSDEEFQQMETHFAQKYGLEFSIIYR